MPANRLRNQHWRQSLHQVCNRGGSIEIAIAPEKSNRHEQPQSDLLWRVRLLRVEKEELLVEQPFALGKSIELSDGVELVAIMAIGQNRWMFRTSIIGLIAFDDHPRQSINALRLEVPASVERCSRRSHYRVETASLELPQVDIWPLLDPKTTLVAERANVLLVEAGDDTNSPYNDEDLVLPEVGPQFTAKLLNLGGGGVGLHIDGRDSQMVNRYRQFWIRMTLPLDRPVPVCAAAKIVHVHMAASQDYYAGLAFDFSQNPSHQDFVAAQISRYIELQQQAQMNRKIA